MRQIRTIYGGEPYKEGGSRSLIIKLFSNELILCWIDFSAGSKDQGRIYHGEVGDREKILSPALEMEAIDWILRYAKL